jgi:hypothetical protein
MPQYNKYYVYPYKVGSRSARALALALGGKVLKREGSSFQAAPHRKVINWGSSSCPYTSLNLSSDIHAISNKLTAFNAFSGHPSEPRIPRFTTDKTTAQSWGRKVVARTVLTGHSGQGIVIKDLDHLSELPDAPLYVEYIPKDAEYRVHVFNGEVIDVQRKVRDPSKEPLDWQVRSHANGFIYTRQNPDGQRHSDITPGDVLLQAKKALASSGLVFGGVDVIMNNSREAAFVLEINTAVRMDGATPEIYANAIRKYYGAL